jgi:hypothetical protein
VEWAAWAGWTCKEPQGFCNPDVQRLAREDGRPPSGNRRGFFFVPVVVSLYPHPERDRQTQSDARRLAAGWLVSFFRRQSGDFTNRNIENVFVESCRALGARGNGRSIPAATPRSSRSRERRAHGEERPASNVFHEQEVRRPRSRFAVVPHSLISQPELRHRSHARRWADARIPTLVGKPAGVFHRVSRRSSVPMAGTRRTTRRPPRSSTSAPHFARRRQHSASSPWSRASARRSHRRGCACR